MFAFSRINPMQVIAAPAKTKARAQMGSHRVEGNSGRVTLHGVAWKITYRGNYDRPLSF